MSVSRQHNKITLHFYFDLMIADGTGLNTIFQELSCLYECPHKISAVPGISYRDALLAMEKKGEAFTKAKDYWLTRIDSMPDAPELPTYSQLNDEDPPFIRRKGTLSSSEWQSFKKTASHYQVTPAALLLTLFGETLKIWSKSSQFMLNVMFFNRPQLHPDMDRVVGNFSTTLLLQMDLKGQEATEQKAKRVQEQLLHDLEHSDFNGINVLNELNRRQGGSQAAAMPFVFACALNLKSSAEITYSQEFKWYGSGVSYNHLETPQVWFDHQVFEDEDGSFCFYWDVREGYFPEGLIEKMFQAYNEALNHAVHEINTPLSLLPQADGQLIQEVNATKTAYTPSCLHIGVFNQVKKTPNNLAIITSQRELTYRELAATSLSLATRLLHYALSAK